LAFTVLWRAAEDPLELRGVAERRHQRFLALSGILLLALASLARPGALFVLPAVVLWAAWRLAGASRSDSLSIRKIRLSWLILLAGSGVILAGYLANSLMFRWLAPANATPFSNFSYIFYGMAVGGKGWTQYLVDHPEVAGLAEAERSSQVLQFALEEARRHPENFLLGSLKQWGLLFSKSYYSLYSFVTWENGWISWLVQAALYALCLLGFAPGWGGRDRARFYFLVAIATGFFISVPFAPPMDANRMRVYAATIPLLALLPAVGLALLIQRSKSLHLPDWMGRIFPPSTLENDGAEDIRNAVWYALGLILITLCGPLAIRLAARPAALLYIYVLYPALISR
jgi:hypothetical protein